MKKYRSWRSVAAAFAGSLFCLASAWCEPHQGRFYAVYPGSAFDLNQMTKKTRWSYVAAQADGFYNHPVGWRSINPAQRAQIIANFKHRQALLEGDLRKMPIVFPGQEGDTIGGEMAALGMSTIGLFENEVAPNKPQDSVPINIVEEACDQYREFVRAAKAKLSASTFVMTAAFQTDGEVLHRSLSFASPVWDYMRKDILVPDSGGSGLDSPVDNYLYGPPQRRQTVWDMTIWTQNHHLKFVYLVSPGHVSTANLIRLLKETIASLEDHDAEPDIYGIETYIPGFPLVPEKNADGSAAGTITGGAYYLLKHRDGDPNTLHLDAIDESGRPLGKIVKISEAERGGAGGHHFHYRLCIKNTSGWLDYAAVLQARWEGGDDWSLTAKSGDDDISSEVLGGGYLFYRKERLNPGAKQYVDILVTPKHDMEHLPSLHLTFNLLPHAGAHAMNSLQFVDERSIEHRDDTHDTIALPHSYDAALH